MKTTTLRLGSLAAVAGALCLVSCSKDQEPAAANVTVSAQDQGLADEENATLSDLVDVTGPEDATLNNGPVAGTTADMAQLLAACATRTYNAATRTLTLDFGTVNCIGPNGVARRGQVVAVFSGPYRQAGGKVTVTLVNYFVNDRQHTGTRILTNLGSGSYSLDVQNASIITPEGTHSWSAQRTYTRTAGFGTRTILDDTYSVTGSATGTNRQGGSYSATIEQPLIKKFAPGCARHFTAGTVRITTARQQNLLLDYDPTGTAACDNIASVVYKGKTYTVRLR